MNRLAAVPRWVLQSILSGQVAYLVLFLGVHAVLALTTRGPTLPNIAAFVLIGVPAALVTLRWELGRGAAVACVVLLVAAVLVSSCYFPTKGHAAGYASWALGAVTIVLLGLTLLGRGVIAWSGMAAVAVVCTAWAQLSGEGFITGFDLVVRHIGTLLIGTLFAIGIRRSNGRLAVYAAVQRRERAAEQAAEARRVAGSEAAAAVLAVAAPALRAIAAGHVFSPDDRRELLVVEGGLRDSIRARALMVAGLPQAVADARRRDVHVLLIDQAEAGDGAAHAMAAAWIAEQLEQVSGGRFVGRIRADGAGLRVSAVTDDSRASLQIPVLSAP